MVKKSENVIQAEFIHLCNIAFGPEFTHDVVIFAIPNEDASASQRQQKARRGVLPGVADVCILWAGRCFFIEFKAGKNGQTPAQKRFGNWCGANGFHYAVHRDAYEALDQLAAWGIPMKTKIRRAA